MFTYKWMVKENVALYTMEFYLAIKNVTALMNLEDIMLSSKKEGQRDKQHISDANVEFKELVS